MGQGQRDRMNGLGRDRDEERDRTDLSGVHIHVREDVQWGTCKGGVGGGRAMRDAPRRFPERAIGAGPGHRERADGPSVSLISG